MERVRPIEKHEGHENPGERMDLEQKPAAGFQNAVYFAKELGRIHHVVQNVDTEHEVGRLVLHWNRLADGGNVRGSVVTFRPLVEPVRKRVYTELELRVRKKVAHRAVGAASHVYDSAGLGRLRICEAHRGHALPVFGKRVVLVERQARPVLPPRQFGGLRAFPPRGQPRGIEHLIGGR